MDSDKSFEKAKLVWDEYKYRHEHCWKLIFQITASVVVLSIVPYTNAHIASSLGWVIILLPVLGILLTVFSMLRVDKELDLWKAVREKHQELQKSLHILHDPDPGKSTFKRDVFTYLGMLLLLSIINCFIIIFKWMPGLDR